MKIEIGIVRKGKLTALLEDRNQKTAKAFHETLPWKVQHSYGMMRYTSTYPWTMIMKIPHHTQIREIYPTGHQTRPSAYSSETHNPHQMLTI